MHHGEASEDIRKSISAAFEDFELGATGRFPGGHLVQEDEGELQFAVGEKNGKVIISFGKSIEWIGMSPREAKLLAQGLQRRANQIETKRVRIR